VSWLDRVSAAVFGPPLSAPAEAVLLEGILDTVGNYDPDSSLTDTQMGSGGVRRLTQSPRDLSPLVQERMLEIAYSLYDRDAVAKRVLELTRDYILGEGVIVEATDKAEDAQHAVQACVDTFWTDPVNHLDRRLHQWVLELGLAGELIPLVTVNPVDGSVRLGTCDPGRIEAVLTDPHNGEIVTDIVLKSVAGAERGRLKVIRYDDDPRSPAYGRLVGVQTDRQGKILDTYQDGDTTHEYVGQCFYWRVNAVTGAKRGRSDLLSIADWIDAIDQMLMNEVDRSALMKNFIWDVSMEGANDAAIDAYLAKTGPPKPGAIRAHNEKMTWTAVAPDLKAIDAKAHLDIFYGHVAIGAGLPKTWLAVTEDSNRATAATLSEPAFKKLASRQKIVLALIAELVTFTLDQAELHTSLPRRANTPGRTLPEPWAVSVNAPDMVTSDVAKLAGALREVGQGLFAALESKIIDLQVGQQVFALIARSLGAEIDLDEMRERLDKAEKEQAERDAALPAPAPAPMTRGTLPTPTIKMPNGVAEARRNGY